MHKLFSAPTHLTKIEIKDGKEPFEVWENRDPFVGWVFVERCAEKETARDVALSCGQKVKFMGFFQSGVEVALDTHIYNKDAVPVKQSPKPSKRTPDFCNQN